MHEWLDTLLECYICGILTLEYFFGRSDMDIKNEARKKRKAREKYNFEELNKGEMR